MELVFLHGPAVRSTANTNRTAREAGGNNPSFPGA